MALRVDGYVRQLEDANVSFLLVHGFGADIDEMRSVAEFLEEQGISSFNLRLPGHGTIPENLEHVSGEDWKNALKQGLQIIRSWDTEYNFVAGISLGGALSLLLAAEHNDIDGLIVLSPAIEISNPLAPLLPLIKIFKKYRTIDLSYIPELYDLSRTKYDREPLSAIQQLLKISKEAKKRLDEVTVPTLIIQSGADKTINPKSGKIVFEGISSIQKELRVIEDAEHVITCHPKRYEMFPYILSFISNITSQSSK